MKLLGSFLWVLAVVMMFATASYQRRTGPTYPLRATVETEGVSHRIRLIRSQETTAEARVVLPDLGPAAEATVHWRRYPTDDLFTPMPMVRETVDGEIEMAAYLPLQPAAGKVEYYVNLTAAEGQIRLPELGGGTQGGDTAILRYKDPVPIPLLIAHVAMMFFAVLIGMRAALGAMFRPKGVARLAWISLGLMTVGGMILGPFVQKYAFGAYWTGWPFGYDLTDNKTLIMWVAWIAACAILVRRKDESDRWARAGVFGAALVMVGVYLIPHSMRGSELDYGAVDTGVPAEEAVGVG
jgi:hypothetical protein